MEDNICEWIPITPVIELLKSLPGVGDTPGIVISLKVSRVDRFISVKLFVAYVGYFLNLISKSDRLYYDHLPKQANHYQIGFLQTNVIRFGESIILIILLI